MFNNKQFIDFLQQAKKQKQDIVWINVLDTQGAAYRKSGAAMVVNSDGEFIGVVSGGCFEEDIVHCAKDILSKKQGKYVAHDLRIKDDTAENWGQGVGCNGLIKLWLEPFYYEENYGAIGEAFTYALNNEKKTLVRSVKNSGHYSFLENPWNKTNFYDEENNLFYQNILSPFKLLILGAGPGCEPLLQIANTLGWQTTIYDTRESNLKHIISADKIHLLHSIEDINDIDVNSFDAGVIMSHNFHSDTIYLQKLLYSLLPYVGIMGPKKRTKIILDSLENRKLSSEILAKLHNPIGLNLGGETPESIALAICAEIESQRNNTTPISLKDKD